MQDRKKGCQLKERNRARDARLKANAGSRKTKEGPSIESNAVGQQDETTGEDDGGEQEEIEDVIAVASGEMQAAIEQLKRKMEAFDEEHGENEDDTEYDDEDEETEDEDVVSATGNEMDEEEDEDEEGSGDADNAEEVDTAGNSVPANVDHLPDYLLTTAFAPKPAALTRPGTPSRKLPVRTERTKSERRVASIGIKAGRRRWTHNGPATLDIKSKPASHQYRHTLQPANPAKFVNAALKLESKPFMVPIPARATKGGRARKPLALTWERRAANVGSAKRTTCPAAHFAPYRSLKR